MRTPSVPSAARSFSPNCRRKMRTKNRKKNRKTNDKPELFLKGCLLAALIPYGEEK